MTVAATSACSLVSTAASRRPRVEATSEVATIMQQQGGGVAQVVDAEEQLPGADEDDLLDEGEDEHPDGLAGDELPAAHARGHQAQQREVAALDDEGDAGRQQAEHDEVDEHARRSSSTKPLGIWPAAAPASTTSTVATGSASDCAAKRPGHEQRCILERLLAARRVAVRGSRPRPRPSAPRARRRPAARRPIVTSVCTACAPVGARRRSPA